MSIIDRLSTKTPRCKSTQINQKNSLIHFFTLDQIPKVKIWHMIANEHSEVIEVGQLLIATEVLDPEQADQDISIIHYGDLLDEDDDSGLGQAGVRTYVAELVTKEVVEAHQAVKYSSLLSFMLKYTSLLTYGFVMNKNTHGKLFKQMCNLGHSR